MNYNVSFDHNNTYNASFADKLCVEFSKRGLNNVRGYTREAIGCKSAETVARDMREHVSRVHPNVYPAIKSAMSIAARKKDEERVAHMALEGESGTRVFKRMVGMEKKPGEYTKREIIKKADSLMRAEESEKYCRPTRFPVSVLATILVCSVMAVFLVLSGAMIKGVSDDIDSLRNESAALSQTERELSIALEEKNDLRVIEKIAVNELGMIKKDFITKNYISMSNEDKVEIYDTDDENADSISSTLLSAIGEQLSRFMEYID